MKKIILKAVMLLTIVLTSQMGFATTYTTVQDGKWSLASTWSGGAIPPETGAPGDIIQINHHVTYKGWHAIKKYTITINSNGIVEGATGSTLNLDDGLTVINYGEINAADINTAWNFNSLTNYGKLLASGKFIHGNGQLVNTAVNSTAGYYPYIELGRFIINNGASLFENHYHIKINGDFESNGTITNRINGSDGTIWISGKFNPNNNFTNDGKIYVDGSVVNGSIAGSGGTCNSDGQFTYSKVVSVNAEMEHSIKFSIYPNPTTDGQIYMEVNGVQFNEIEIYNSMGQNVSSQVPIAKSGEHQFSLNMANLPIGFYMVRTPYTSAKVLKQ